MCQDVLVTPSASVCWLALFPSIGEENIALDFQTPISAAITDTQFHAQVQKQFICHSYVYAPLSWLKLRNKLQERFPNSLLFRPWKKARD